MLVGMGGWFFLGYPASPEAGLPKKCAFNKSWSGYGIFLVLKIMIASLSGDGRKGDKKKAFFFFLFSFGLNQKKQKFKTQLSFHRTYLPHASRLRPPPRSYKRIIRIIKMLLAENCLKPYYKQDYKTFDMGSKLQISNSETADF